MHALKLCILLLSAVVLFADASASVRVQQYTRKINLKEQYAKITETLKFKNSGAGSLNELTICQLESLTQHEASYTVTQDKVALKVATTGSPDGVHCVSVSLAKPVPSGDVGTVLATGHYTQVLTPFPEEVLQGENQLMLFVDNLYALSPYLVSSQNTEVELPLKKVESYTKVKPATVTGSIVKFGRYDSIQPFTFEQLRVHFEHNKPFMEVTQLVREIEVSHWGNIYVEESYELRNAGAGHKGSFSRLKHSANVQANRGNAFRDLSAALPPAARQLYYRDLIGNISSSRVRSTMTATLLDVELRYPLMGGWKIDFVLGYSLPLKGFLYQKEGFLRQLLIDFSSPIDGVVINDLIVKVVLPEGSSDIQATLPFDVSQEIDTKYTYLDTTGRPVLVLRKANVVPGAHTAKLQVDYAFNPLSMLREPLLLVSVFAAFFAVVMVYQRWDFTIAKDNHYLEAKNKDRVSSTLAALQRTISGISGPLKKLEELAGSATEDTSLQKAALEYQLSESTTKAKQQVKDVEELSPKAAADAREVLAKAHAAQAKATSALGTRMDALKKTSSPQELYKRSSAAVKGAAEARREMEALADKVFSSY